MRVLLLLLIVCGLALPAEAQNSLANPPKPPPRRGMTKEQVFARYGAPRHSARVDGLEVWYYRVKFNEVYGRTFAPFENSSENVHLGEIYFDRTGRIVRFNWTHSREN